MRFSGIFYLALSAGIAVLGASAAASAGNLHRDHVYADSYGNLVIQSPYGHKRILVGQGYRADEFAAAGSDEPEVVYLDDEDGYRYRDDCYRPPVLLKGRSYMYGLPDGVVPEPSGRCEWR